MDRERVGESEGSCPWSCFGRCGPLGSPGALALRYPRWSRLFSLRQEFPDAWNQLLTASDGSPLTCTLQLSKQHLPAFLDYEWKTEDDETMTPRPIKLEVTGLTGHPSQQPATGAGPGVLSFDLTNSLSTTTIRNDAVVDCVLTLDGELRAEDWNDLYLLVDYDVGT